MVPALIGVIQFSSFYGYTLVIPHITTKFESNTVRLYSTPMTGIEQPEYDATFKTDCAKRTSAPLVMRVGTNVMTN